MKRPQATIHAHTMRESQVIRSKKSRFIIRSKFSCSTIVFFFIDNLLKLQEQIFAPRLEIGIQNQIFLEKPEVGILNPIN